MLAIIAPENKYVSNLLDEFNYEKKESKNNLNVYKINYDNHQFLIVTTGYGKVNIASNMMYVYQKYKIKLFVLIGTAGSINENCNIFDVVIPKYTLQYDVDFMPLGLEAAQLPGLNTWFYETNDDINNCILDVCKDKNYYTDLVVSSDMYVCNYRLSQSIKHEYDACCVDVECGSVGEFCYTNNIPYSCIKVVSNYANNNGLKQYNMYDERASKICQNITSAFIKKFYE